MHRLVALAVVTGVVLSCASASLIERVEAYRAARARGDVAAEAAFLAGDARIWFETKEGDGEKLEPGRSGRWGRWDTFFRSSSERRDWHVEGNAVTATVHEMNDFYRLLDWTPIPYRMTWWFDGAGRITGVLVASQPGKASSRMEEFKAWARERHPDELAYLMPGGKLDPTGDRPERWKAILTAWRAEAGFPPVN